MTKIIYAQEVNAHQLPNSYDFNVTCSVKGIESPWANHPYFFGRGRMPPLTFQATLTLVNPAKTEENN